jgi:hypothetical protein
VALSDLLTPWLEVAPAALPSAEQEHMLALQG